MVSEDQVDLICHKTFLPDHILPLNPTIKYEASASMMIRDKGSIGGKMTDKKINKGHTGMGLHNAAGVQQCDIKHIFEMGMEDQTCDG